MNAVQSIPVANLALAFIPVIVVLGMLSRWSLDSGATLYAVARMLTQLLLVGYVLVFIFDTDEPGVVAGVLAFMIAVASWIAIRPLGRRRPRIYVRALVSIAVGALATLALVTQGVLSLEPWYSPRYLLPLGGMILANSMNSVSLAAERFESECSAGAGYQEARDRAFRTALIPLTNTLLAVGIVSLPGMMTGQILSGVSPLIAARYQIMVMCMTFGAAGMATVCYLMLARSNPAQTGSGEPDGND